MNNIISTFSVVGRSKDGKQYGVAVASKFLAVGAYVPAASIYGALATQSKTNMRLRVDGLRMLEAGLSAQQVLEKFFVLDDGRDFRQAGIIDTQGSAATYTGSSCKPWAGGRAESHVNGSYAIQGNLLSGPQVVDAMVNAWVSDASDASLAQRLLNVLEAGDNAGGDIRGRQAAAVYVVEEGMGFDGTSDVLVDLRCDNDERPIQQVRHLLALHEALFNL